MKNILLYKIRALQVYSNVLCPRACGRGRCNDNKNNHVVGGLVVYKGVMQWCYYTTPACDCKVKVVLSSKCIERFTLKLLKLHVDRKRKGSVYIVLYLGYL